MKNIAHKFSVLLILSSFYLTTFAQNVSVSEDANYTPKSSAMLDVHSESKGLLVPRMTTVQRIAINSPVNGLLVFDTDYNAFFYYLNNGTKSTWTNLSSYAPASVNSENIDEALFSVVNSDGDTVFAVYQEGVQINVGDGNSKAMGARGGFAVASRGVAKGEYESVMKVTGDSIRLYVDESTSKAARGGFAVASRGVAKGGITDILQVSSDSVRIYLDEGTGKAARGGFAVASRGVAKGGTNEYMRITTDSIRMYVDEQSGTGKAARGGFAVASRGVAKGGTNDILQVSSDSVRIYLDDGLGKAARGGFAVASRGVAKSGTNEYMRITTDSIRMYVDEQSGTGKAARGGFAVASRGVAKGGTSDILQVSSDSVRIYLVEGNSKAARGGFAVASRGVAKGGYSDVMMVTEDSTRIYIADENAGFGVENSSGSTNERLMRLNKENYFIGHRTGINTTHPEDPGIDPKGRRNTFIGFNSGVDNESGYQNVFLGYVAGFKSREESNRNVFIGSNAGQNNYNSSDNVFIGFGAGLDNGFSLGANDNVFLGSESGYSNKGSRNVFIGKSSGYANTLGIDNVFMGHKAGYSNSTGSYNVFVGEGAGDANTEGLSNVFMGRAAGNKNIDGNNNVFIGKAAGFSGESNDYNVFIGDSSGYSTNSTWTTKNVFVGYSTGRNNTIGGENVFLGNACGYKNENGARNVFIGDRSGYNNISGGSCVFIGDNAGFSNTDGSYNVFIGKSAGSQNETGGRNVFLGYEAGQGNTIGFGNVFLGEAAGQATTISNYNVAIGRNAGQSNTGENNVYIGGEAGSANNAGSNNVFIGYQSSKMNYTGSNNVTIGYQAGRYETNSNRFYIANMGGTTLASGIDAALIYGEFDNKILRINADLGIGTGNPEAPLDIESNSFGSAIHIEEYGAGTEEWQLGVDVSGNLDFFDGTVGRVTFEDGGNVGIGTTNPAAKLQVLSTSSGANPQLLLKDNASAGYARLTMTNTNSAGKYFTIAAKSDNSDDTNSKLNFWYHNGTSGANHLTLTGDGNVGIGTTEPGNHQLYVTSSGTGTGGTTGYFENTDPDGLAMHIINSDGSSDDNALLVTNKGTGNIMSLDSYHGGSSWDREFSFSAYGVGKCDGSWQTGGADFAEYFETVKPTKEYTEGDILMIGAEDYSTDLCSSTNARNILGVYTDNPGIVGNSGMEDADNEGKILVGLIGVVDTKVSNENGNIVIGDFITISSKSGVGMKAVGSGMVVGRALENLSGIENGKIKVFVNVHWVDLGGSESQQALISAQQTEIDELKREVKRINDLEKQLEELKVLIAK